MTYISVDKSRLKTFASTSKQISTNVDNIRADIMSISNNLDWDIKGASNIESILSQINRNITNYVTTLSKSQLFLDTAYTEYSGLDNVENAGSDSKDPNQKENSIAWKSGVITGAGSLFGIGAAGELAGELAGASYEIKTQGGISKVYNKDTGKYEFDTLGVEGEISGEAHLAKGSASGNYGLLNGNANVSVGNISATGAAGANLYKNGKLSPQIYAKAEVEVAAAKGEAEVAFGSDNNDIHVKGEGALLEASAKAEGAAGKVSYENEKTHQKVEGYGVMGEVGAEAYAAEGSVSGGIKIFGVDIDVSLTGKAGGAGASVGGAITTGGCSFGGSAGLLFGGGIDVSIDWTNFKIGW